MKIIRDKSLTLKDGSIIGYAEYGNPQGKPVMYFHGLPSSRLEMQNPDTIEAAEKLQVRLILMDRPGIGLSSYKPYTLTSYPDMVVEFADKMGLEKFPVIGTSSGGKYALACAWKIPHRLTAVHVVGGTAPFDLPGVKTALSKHDQQVYGSAVKMPWLFSLMLKKMARDVKKNPASILSLFSEVAEVDKRMMSRPDVTTTLGEMVMEAFRQGTRGAILDWQIEAKPWGLDLREITVPVVLHHGEEDRVVSKEQARILAEQIPGVQVKYYKGEGHSLFVSRIAELLRAAIQT